MLKSFFSHSPPMSGVNVKGTNKVLAPGIFGSLRGQPEFWFCDQPEFGSFCEFALTAETHNVWKNASDAFDS